MWSILQGKWVGHEKYSPSHCIIIIIIITIIIIHLFYLLLLLILLLLRLYSTDTYNTQHCIVVVLVVVLMVINYGIYFIKCKYIFSLLWVVVKRKKIKTKSKKWGNAWSYFSIWLHASFCLWNISLSLTAVIQLFSLSPTFLLYG